MGTVILAIAFVIEAAFAAFCLITRSSQVRVRSYARIGAFAAFVLLALLSVIQWSFRWYGLAALLLVWAALGARALIRKRGEGKRFNPGGIVLKAAAMLLLVLIAVTPALIFPQSKLPPMTGNYEVATAVYTYSDGSRTETFTQTGESRKVNVEFWYPKDSPGPCPLVVFSHGAFGLKVSNTSTFMDLASNGYVVCSIDHPYHSLFTIGTDRRLVRADPAFLREVMDLNNARWSRSG